jgi:hypothetical protein
MEDQIHHFASARAPQQLPHETLSAAIMYQQNLCSIMVEYSLGSVAM